MQASAVEGQCCGLSCKGRLTLVLVLGLTVNIWPGSLTALITQKWARVGVDKKRVSLYLLLKFPLC